MAGDQLEEHSDPLRRVSGIARRAIRLARRGLKVVWWAVTLQLPRRIRAHRANKASMVGRPVVESQPEAVAVAGPSMSVASEVARFSAPGTHFEPTLQTWAKHAPQAKVIAFYLPQFHAIPENDEWWGTGFTEWRNVSRGSPRFVGHHQPRIPRDLGFYDLTDPTVMPRQVAMAKSVGVHGFCFYYYRFAEGRLLDTPIERFLATPAIDMPFCLLWANEPWSRTWDGLDTEVLRPFTYDETVERGLLADLVRHFADPRYIRVDGRPVFVVYRPAAIPDAAAVFARWRETVLAETGERPILLMAQSFGDYDPRPYGLDGAIEFPPHHVAGHLPDLRDRLHRFDRDFSGVVSSYDDVVDLALHKPVPPYPLARTVMPSWDNEARRPGRGFTIIDSTPDRYESLLRETIRYARDHPIGSEAIVFINAWNEWAEAAYLEPDVHYGVAYLNATGRAVLGTPLEGPPRLGTEANPPAG